MISNFGIWQPSFGYEMSDQKASAAYFEHFNIRCLHSQIKLASRDILDHSEIEASNEKSYKTPQSKYKYIFQIMNSPSGVKPARVQMEQHRTAETENPVRDCARQLLCSFESVQKRADKPKEVKPVKVLTPKKDSAEKEMHPLLKFFSRVVNKPKKTLSTKTLGEAINPELREQLHQTLLKKLLDL